MNRITKYILVLSLSLTSCYPRYCKIEQKRNYQEERKAQLIRHPIPLKNIVGIDDSILKWFRMENQEIKYRIYLDSNELSTLSDSVRTRVIIYLINSAHLILSDSTSICSMPHCAVYWFSADDSSAYYGDFGKEAIAKKPCVQIEYGVCGKGNCFPGSGTMYELKKIDTMYYFTGKSRSYYY